MYQKFDRENSWIVVYFAKLGKLYRPYQKSPAHLFIVKQSYMYKNRCRLELLEISWPNNTTFTAILSQRIMDKYGCTCNEPVLHSAENKYCC
jgi:hypothetical protein